MESVESHMWIWNSVEPRQGGLACCDSWGRKESDTTEQLNCTEEGKQFESTHCGQNIILSVQHASMCFWIHTMGMCELGLTSVQFSSVSQSHLTLCNPMNRSMPGLPVHHQHQEFTQTHVHRVSDAFQPSHPLSSPSPPTPNPSQHQGLFQWVNSSHEVAKVLEFQL